MRILPILTATLSVFALLGLSPAIACDCPAQKDTPDKALENSTLVFLGTVSAKEHNAQQDKVFFEVKKAWKGTEKGKNISLVTNLVVFGCDYEFEQGKEYMVFASPPKPKEDAAPKDKPRVPFGGTAYPKMGINASPPASASVCGLTTPSDSNEAAATMEALGNPDYYIERFTLNPAKPASPNAGGVYKPLP
ncbi:MAG: uncharacterized protein K0R63_957 [Rickettsiales bacterium]|nr:uncharacterized protein [Rickettsiales bacterium]